MKAACFIPVALLAGLIVGAWGARDDLRRSRQADDGVRTARKTAQAAGFDALARLVNVPAVAGRKPRPAASAQAPSAEPKAPKAEGVAAPAGAGAKPHEGAKRPRLPKDRRDLQERLDEAAELWRARVELARTQWKAKLNVAEGASAEAFDAALNAMNESLAEVMTALADEIDRSGRMTPELSLRLMGEATTLMARTYDALAESVPGESRDALSDVPVFEFVDPGVFEPLVGVQDKLTDVRWAEGASRR